MVDALSFAAGVVVGLGGALAVWLIVRWLAGAADRTAVEADGERLDPLSLKPDSAGSTERRTLADLAHAMPPRAASGPSDGSTPGISAPADPVDLAERLLRHLASQPEVAIDDYPGVGRTQQGIQQVVGCPQSTLSTVLKRLSAAGLVRVERRHVIGPDRRVLTYWLTQRGQRIARELATPPESPRQVVPRGPGR